MIGRAMNETCDDVTLQRVLEKKKKNLLALKLESFLLPWPTTQTSRGEPDE
jgi:hypothetical protein